ncbi:unnamed protein product [Heligmosomoides polygyrus]|uniref:Reverse transcriptase n=1 Tax=Heligmosomoides polygyrus TaxID=6339 RepID=A0A3P7X3D6_HELPZ|nr:unnamed protein product [Heligmosomoides polygyrus]
MRGLPRVERPRPKKLVRIGTLNETRWKGEKAKEIGEGVKLFYNGENTMRSSVGKAESLNDSVAAVQKISERIMSLRLDTKVAVRSRVTGLKTKILRLAIVGGWAIGYSRPPLVGQEQKKMSREVLHEFITVQD